MTLLSEHAPLGHCAECHDEEIPVLPHHGMKICIACADDEHRRGRASGRRQPHAVTLRPRPVEGWAS